MSHRFRHPLPRASLTARRLLCALVPALLGVPLALTAPAPATRVLAVSKPPAPVLPSDPAPGRLFGSPDDLSSARTLFTTAGGPRDLGYVVFGGGDAYITFDDGPDARAPGGFMVVRALGGRPGGHFDAGRDRWLSGPRAALQQPKDLELAPTRRAVIVADFGAANVKVFDMAARGDAAPRFVAANLGAPGRRPWGLAYDERADRLFVGATDGTLLVYDRFLGSRGGAGPSRTVMPTLRGEGVSANLHDLVYVRERDTVIVLDVGPATETNQAGFDTDGSLLVLRGASRASGRTPAHLRVRGPASQLGNPVGLTLDGERVFVAEKARDVVLRFDGLLTLAGDRDLAPSAAVSVIEPESVALMPGPPRPR
ncbi:hypothetical protein DAETH_34060 (plasmid) [Deinococcus aetherius]|uniref:NHL repeat containing protein n=1 Tax=Deinococcus aetherius TaxID=200252 RepID=A0ABM8AIB0_9DEIO|nr:hypothetical protein [Deinococcus aetherius]BDP43437.1 hypothetical protein DAETH_34060 [Deinococcus aetherius]